MTASIRRLVFMAALLASAACSDAPTPTAKLPHIRTETVSHPVIFADDVTRLTPAESAALDAFASGISAGAATRVALAIDDARPRAVARARSVRDRLVAAGYAKQSIYIVPAPSMDPRMVVVSIAYARVVPPAPCPDWSKDARMNYNNTDASNFGCATYNNLVVQLADPADYDGRHVAPVSEGARDSVALQKYTAGTSASAGSASSGGSGSSGGTTTTTTSSP